jgi:hypothetical protein
MKINGIPADEVTIEIDGVEQTIPGEMLGHLHDVLSHPKYVLFFTCLDSGGRVKMHRWMSGGYPHEAFPLVSAHITEQFEVIQPGVIKWTHAELEKLIGERRLPRAVPAPRDNIFQGEGNGS